MIGCPNCGHLYGDHPDGEHCVRCSCEAWAEWMAGLSPRCVFFCVVFGSALWGLAFCLYLLARSAVS